MWFTCTNGLIEYSQQFEFIQQLIQFSYFNFSATTEYPVRRHLYMVFIRHMKCNNQCSTRKANKARDMKTENNGLDWTELDWPGLMMAYIKIKKVQEENNVEQEMYYNYMRIDIVFIKLIGYLQFKAFKLIALNLFCVRLVCRGKGVTSQSPKLRGSENQRGIGTSAFNLSSSYREFRALTSTLHFPCLPKSDHHTWWSNSIQQIV